MRESIFESRRRWIIAAAGSVAVLVTVLMLFRLPPPVASLPVSLAQSVPKAALTMARPDDSDPMIKEEAQLRDLRPLFLPTERNAALPEPRLEPGRTFLDNEAIKLKFTDAEAHISRDLPPIVTLDGKVVQESTPVDALSPGETGIHLQGFGRTRTSIDAFKPRGGYLEVTALKEGRAVLNQELPAEVRPPGDKPWGPVEFMAVVDAAGLVSPLVVTIGSRVEEVDVHFRDFLARSFRIGDRLTPGFYRITVSP